jgi:hypothetical protein
MKVSCREKKLPTFEFIQFGGRDRIKVSLILNDLHLRGDN